MRLILVAALLACCAQAFKMGAPRPLAMGQRNTLHTGIRRSSGQVFNMAPSSLSDFLSMPLAETTVSEEEILDIVGKASDLPDPIISVSIAVFVLVGVAVLQFSLGDLTKEEGQARVRDFLATKRETERKRGYFD